MTAAAPGEQATPPARSVWADYLRVLEPRERRLFLVTALMCVAGALAEVAFAVSVTEYAACLAGDCSATWTVVDTDGRTEDLVAGSVVLGTVLFVRMLLQLGLLALAQRLNRRVQTSLVRRLLDVYLHLSWPDFRSRHQSHYFRRCATTAVDAAYTSQQLVNLLSASFVLVALTVVAFVREPVLALVLLAGLGMVLGLSQISLGPLLRRAADVREAHLQRWSAGMSEAFGAFKEVRIYQREALFLARLEESIDGVSANHARLALLPALPRLVIEWLAFTAVMAVIVSWQAAGRDLASLLPVLVLLAVIARSSLPAVSAVMTNRAYLSGSVVNLRLVAEELALGEPGEGRPGRVDRIVVPAVPGRREVRLRDVGYRHPDAAGFALSGLDLTIEGPGWTALTGPSGAGKSTLMEILCGLLPPTVGVLEHAWHPDGSPPRVAYVPQQVAVVDGSLLDNVTLAASDPDRGRVRACLATAALEDRLATLDGGLDAVLGSQGVALSGGERQRLAIARALYADPDLLLLDEATSGLDAATEDAVLGSIRRAHPDLTVVLVSHRAQSLTFADRVIDVRDFVPSDRPDSRQAP